MGRGVEAELIKTDVCMSLVVPKVVVLQGKTKGQTAGSKQMGDHNMVHMQLHCGNVLFKHFRDTKSRTK